MIVRLVISLQRFHRTLQGKICRERIKGVAPTLINIANLILIGGLL